LSNGSLFFVFLQLLLFNSLVVELGCLTKLAFNLRDLLVISGNILVESCDGLLITSGSSDFFLLSSKSFFGSGQVVTEFGELGDSLVVLTIESGVLDFLC